MVTVQELIKMLPGITIYAGKSGLNKPISTISFIDAPSSVEWLNGGEVILTTAFLYKENGDIQYRFVSKLIEMGVTALGIKIGRYIELIPDAIIELADDKQFPIFGISYETIWSEIFTAYYNLALEKKSRSILSRSRFMLDTQGMWKAFVTECLLDASTENLDEYIHFLKIREDYVSTIIVFGGGNAAAVVDEFRMLMRTSIVSHDTQIIDAVMDGGESVMLYAKSGGKGLYSFTNELREALRELAPLFPGCRVWVGEPAATPQELQRSYTSAVRAMELGVFLMPEESVVFYRDVSLIDHLYRDGYDYSEITYLGSKIKSFDACRTLEIFLESGNVKRAAESSFIHDNAMRYRIQKIEQILLLDLSKPVNRYNLLLKLKLWRLAQSGVRS